MTSDQLLETHHFYSTELKQVQKASWPALPKNDGFKKLNKDIPND